MRYHFTPFTARALALGGASLLALAVAGQSARGQNAIGNGSFETPQGAAGSEVQQNAGTPWNSFGAVFLENSNTPSNPQPAQDGNQYIKTFGGGSGVFQDISVTPGQTFDATGWGRFPSTDSFGAGSQFGQLLIIFENAGDNGQVGNTLHSDMLISGTTPLDIWEKGELTGTVPTGAAFIRYQFNEGASAGGAVYFDNASLTLSAVPEPASIGLLAAGTMALTLRRRRATV